MKKLGYVFIGFVACLVLFVGCNAGLFGTVGTSIADTIIDATEITFDGEGSGLDATTVKGAIDELAGDVNALKAQQTFTMAELAGDYYWWIVGQDPNPITISEDGVMSVEGSDFDISINDGVLVMSVPGYDSDAYFHLYRQGDVIWAEGAIYAFGTILQKDYYDNMSSSMSLPVPK